MFDSFVLIIELEGRELYLVFTHTAILTKAGLEVKAEVELTSQGCQLCGSQSQPWGISPDFPRYNT